MTPSKPRHTPVQSFGPHIMAALLKGALDGFTVEMPYHRAVKFRQRIYMLRSAMRAEDHPKYVVASRVRISISWSKAATIMTSSRGVSRPRNRNETCTVEVAPSDSEYAEDLRAVGVDPNPTAERSADPPRPIAGPRESLTIDDLLGELKEPS